MGRPKKAEEDLYTTINIGFPPALLDEVTEIALELNEHRTAVIRGAVRYWLKAKREIY